MHLFDIFFWMPHNWQLLFARCLLQPLSHGKSVASLCLFNRFYKYLVNLSLVCLNWFLLSGCLSVKPGFLLVLTHWDVEQRAFPTALFHILDYFETHCLVHVSVHPTIYRLFSKECQIQTSAPPSYFHLKCFLLVATYLEWLFSLVWGQTCIKIIIKWRRKKKSQTQFSQQDRNRFVPKSFHSIVINIFSWDDFHECLQNCPRMHAYVYLYYNW